MERWSGKVAVVTGASVGIGAAIVEALVRKGLKVVGLARRMDKLQEVGKRVQSLPGSFYPIQADVRKEEDIVRAFEWTEKELGGVDILINNAGVAVAESIIDGKAENFHKIMDVNVIAPSICAREAIRSMKKRKKVGHIIVMNSMTGHFANLITVPVSLYPCSKFAITAFCQTLRTEIQVEKLPIKVTSISPGPVDTHMISDIVSLSNLEMNFRMLKSEDVADSVVYALSAPQRAEVFELLIGPANMNLLNIFESSS